MRNGPSYIPRPGVKIIGPTLTTPLLSTIPTVILEVIPFKPLSNAPNLVTSIGELTVNLRPRLPAKLV